MQRARAVPVDLNRRSVELELPTKRGASGMVQSGLVPKVRLPASAPGASAVSRVPHLAPRSASRPSPAAVPRLQAFSLHPPELNLGEAHRSVVRLRNVSSLPQRFRAAVRGTAAVSLDYTRGAVAAGMAADIAVVLRDGADLQGACCVEVVTEVERYEVPLRRAPVGHPAA